MNVQNSDGGRGAIPQTAVEADPVSRPIGRHVTTRFLATQALPRDTATRLRFVEKAQQLGGLAAGRAAWRRCFGDLPMLDELPAESDFEQFIAARCKLAEDCRARASALWAAYQTHARLRDLRPRLGPRGFGMALGSLGLQRMRSNGIIYRGIELKSAARVPE